MRKLSTIIVFFFFLITELIFPQPGTYYNLIDVTGTNFISDLKARIRSPYTKISYNQFHETNIANVDFRNRTIAIMKKGSSMQEYTISCESVYCRDYFYQ